MGNNSIEIKTSKMLDELAAKIDNRDVYFLWSGGEDSTALLKLLIEAELHRKCRLMIVTIPFPQHVYYRENLSICKSYFEDLNIVFNVLYTNSFIDYATQHSKACEECKIARRTEFLGFYTPLCKKNDVIVTAHNLSDLMAYYVELMIERLSLEMWKQKSNRMLEVTNKFFKSYITERGVELYRPMLCFSQQEIKRVISHKTFDAGKMNIVENKCLWADQRKRLLQEYFAKSGIVSDYSVVFKLLHDNFAIPTVNEFRELSFDTYLV